MKSRHVLLQDRRAGALCSALPAILPFKLRPIESVAVAVDSSATIIVKLAESYLPFKAKDEVDTTIAVPTLDHFQNDLLT